MQVHALQRASVADAAAWHQVVTASTAHDLPGVPPPAPGQIHAQLTQPALDSHRLAWLATGADGVPVAVAGLRVFTSPGRHHLAELELHVAPHTAAWEPAPSCCRRPWRPAAPRTGAA
ncbi:hypothetical protein AB0901_00245 [Streptomyces roseifaciens]